MSSKKRKFSGSEVLEKDGQQQQQHHQTRRTFSHVLPISLWKLIQACLVPIEIVALCFAVENLSLPKILLPVSNLKHWSQSNRLRKLDYIYTYTWAPAAAAPADPILSIRDCLVECPDNDKDPAFDWVRFFQNSWSLTSDGRLVFALGSFLVNMRIQSTSRPPGWFFLEANYKLAANLSHPVTVFWEHLFGFPSPVDQVKPALVCNPALVYWLSMEFGIPKAFFLELVETFFLELLERGVPLKNTAILVYPLTSSYTG
jgi:hypothetical protein